MSSQNKPPEPPDRKPLDPPTQPTGSAPLDLLVEAFAKISGDLGGKQGFALRQHIDDVKSQVDTVLQRAKIEVDDHEARKAAVAEIEKLIETFAATGTAVGQAVGKQREAITSAFRGVDLTKLAEGMRLFSDWLQHPTEDGAIHVQKLIAELQTTMGSFVGYDPEREEAERKAAIKRDVQASLDEIFRGKKKP